MVVSFPDGRLFAALTCLGLAAAVSAQDVPILLDAASTDFDRRNQRLVFEQVSITRGPLGISAEHANSSQLDFADSTWTFRGNVRIVSAQSTVTAETATMQFANHQLQRATIEGAPALLNHQGDAEVRVNAQRAVVLFGDQQLQRITLTGTPASFEHVTRREQRAVTTGHAEQLTYDLGGGRIALAGNALVSQADNEIRGKEITYDIAAQRVVAGGDNNGERVRIVITPPAEASGGQ